MSTSTIAPATSRPLAALGVHSDEVPLVVPALVFSCLVVGGTAISTIASDSLFVSKFSLGDLSRFFVIASAVRVAVAFGYGAVASRFAGPRLDALILLLASLSMGISGIVSRADSSAVIYGVCLAQLVLPPLLPLVAFNAILGCFHARQAKRLLPLVAAAATIGTMAVGACARGLATTIGAGPLLVLGAALVVVTLPLPKLLAKRAADAGIADETPQKHAARGLLATIKGTLADVKEVRAARLVIVLAIFSAAAVSVVDFAFKASLKAAYGRDEMAAFMGTFSIVANGLVLAAQLFVSSRFVGRFGVGASLRSFPISLLAAGGLIAIAPGVATGVAAKLAEQVFRYALGASTADLILTPAPSAVRTRAKIVVKGIAGPAGALVAGLVLAAFGERGPSWIAIGAMLAGAGLAGLFLTRGARAAYAAALASALGEGRVSLDVSPASAAILQRELTTLLRVSAANGDRAAALRILAVMSDRVFSLADVEPALSSPDAEIRAAATRAAVHLAHGADFDRLLAMIPPATADGTGLEVEREILRGARELKVKIARERLEKDIELTDRSDDKDHVDLWSDALVALAAHDRPVALRRLRRAAVGADSPRRAAALRGIGLIGERNDAREVLRAMSSDDPAVYAEAASAAVRIDAQGAIETLVARLSTGPHVRASARALALAGPRAVGALVAALPTTRGERAILPTAVASEGSVSGTIRAARVLARLGAEGSTRALERYGDLGYRARNAIARAFSAVSLKQGQSIDSPTVLRAMDLTVEYAESLVDGLLTARPGLLRAELSHRVSETAARVLDLASAIGERNHIAQARCALTKGARDRGHALELLENVLPQSLAARTVALLDAAQGDSAHGPVSAAPAQRYDGWLEKCARFDAGELKPGDAMISVLEKVLILRDSSLFAGLSGEELYPVAEIAESIEKTAGAPVVKEGDPGDALFVVASGKFSIEKGATKLREIEHGAAFGELALLDGAPRAASVVAITDGRVLRIPRAEFEALLDESPELSRGVIRTLLGHLRGGA